MLDKQTLEFIDNVRWAATKFIAKVEGGRARSVETYADMKALKVEAEALLCRSEPAGDLYAPGTK
jgi:hypothetical protein